MALFCVLGLAASGIFLGWVILRDYDSLNRHLNRETR